MSSSPAIGRVRFNRDLASVTRTIRAARECGTTKEKNPYLRLDNSINNNNIDDDDDDDHNSKSNNKCIIIRGRIWKRFGAEARMSASAAMCNRQFALN